MEYKSVTQLAEVATVDAEARPPMSQIERLQRWADLLDQNPDRRLNTLFETEFQFPAVRDAMRVDDSPVSVALADPLLRSDGLAGDSYGEAKRFFGLTDHQLHHALCFCHYGATLPADSAAKSLRGVVSSLSETGLMARVWRMFG
jgi:hypothetical protein